MSEIEIFQNPDIVSKIAEQFNYLSSKDRASFLHMLNNIPGIAELPYEIGDKILTDIFESRAQYNKSVYDSVLLEKPDLVTNRGIVYSYQFAVVYSKGGDLPTIDEGALADIIDDDPGEFHHYIFPIGRCLKGGLLWSLNGPAAKISVGDDIIYFIYCDDLERYTFLAYIDRTLTQEIWYNKGKIDSFGDLPASIRYYKGTGKVSEKIWFKDGKIHRDGDLPAKETYHVSGIIDAQEWYKNNELFRDNDMPTIIYYYKGKIYTERWTKGYMLHRDGDKPAIIVYFPKTGHTSIEEYWKNNGIYRENNQPSRLVYTDSPQGSWVSKAIWYTRGGNMKKEEKYDKQGRIKKT